MILRLRMTLTHRATFNLYPTFYQMSKPKPKVSKATNPVGRPSIIDQIILGKLEQAFAIGCTDIEACSFANINPSTLYLYQTKNPDFIDRKEGLKAKPIFKARHELVKGLTDNPELALKFLERKLKSEFSTRTETTGKDGEAINLTTNNPILTVITQRLQDEDNQ